MRREKVELLVSNEDWEGSDPFRRAAERRDLLQAISNPGKNIHQRLQALVRGAKWVLAQNDQLRRIVHELNKILDAYEDDIEFVNSGQPWTDHEDEYLVRKKAEGCKILELSLNLGRSPASIATRISELVGIPRKTIRIDGKRIEGVLEGDDVDGKFTGLVHRIEG